MADPKNRVQFSDRTLQNYLLVTKDERGNVKYEITGNDVQMLPQVTLSASDQKRLDKFLKED